MLEILFLVPSIFDLSTKKYCALERLSKKINIQPHVGVFKEKKKVGCLSWSLSSRHKTVHNHNESTI